MATPNITTQLSFGPRFTLPGKHNYFSRNIRYKTGHRVGWQLGVKLRSWTLVYQALDDTEYDALMTFLNARGGGRDRFYFDLVQTGETDIPVQIVGKDDEVDDAFTSPRTRDVRVRIEEVVD